MIVLTMETLHPIEITTPLLVQKIIFNNVLIAEDHGWLHRIPLFVILQIVFIFTRCFGQKGMYESAENNILWDCNAVWNISFPLQILKGLSREEKKRKNETLV